MTRVPVAGGLVVRVAALLTLAFGAAHAQAVVSNGPRALVRLDAIAARSAAVQAGLGITVPAGTYLRLEATVAGGPSRRDGAIVGGARADLLGRFLVDPFAQTTRGPYAGGGVSFRRDGGDRTRAYLLAVFGVEGRRRHGAYPALELGLGGGVRLGVALRGSPAGRR